jgi:hypothetical protein
MVDTGLAGPAIHGCYIRSYDPLGQSLLGERQALRELVGVPVIHFRLWQISPPRPTLRQGPGCSESPTTSPQDLNKKYTYAAKEGAAEAVRGCFAGDGGVLRRLGSLRGAQWKGWGRRRVGSRRGATSLASAPGEQGSV